MWGADSPSLDFSERPLLGSKAPVCCQPLPVYPGERTSSEPVGMSQKCHNRPHAPRGHGLPEICRTGSVEHHLRRERSSAGGSSNLIRSARQRYKECWPR
jgi:hypothetical protein